MGLLRVHWTARRSNQSILKELNPEYSIKDWCWSSSILVIWCTQMTHWKSPSWWERSRAEGEEVVRGWDGWTASPVQWTWTWANSWKRWGTERPGLLQSMGSQRVGHDWVTEQQQHRLCACCTLFLLFLHHVFSITLSSCVTLEKLQNIYEYQFPLLKCE